MSHLDTVKRKYGGLRADGTKTADKSDKTPSVTSVTDFEDAPDVHSAKKRAFGTSVNSVVRRIEKSGRNFVTSGSASKKHFDNSIPLNTKNKESSGCPNSVPTKLTKGSMSAMEQRRLRLLQEMANDRQAKKYYWLVDIDVDPDYVIVTLGIRDLTTCELLIRKDRYDPFDFLKIVDRNE